jgi:signal transduction histidine kinase
MVISERLFNRLVLTAVGVGFAALIAVGSSAAYVVKRNQDYTVWVNHTYDVRGRIADMSGLLDRSEAARRGYMLNQNPTTYEVFNRTVAQLPASVASIRKLTVDNREQQANLNWLEPIMRREIELLKASVVLTHDGRTAEAIKTYNTDDSVPTVRAIRALTDAMTAQENRLLVIREADQKKAAQTLYEILAVAAFLMVTVGVGSIWVIMNYTQDLTRSRNAERRMNDNLEAAVDERTAELKRANDEIQRFAYIVSHDLRSPLVNVMGFTAELEASAKPLGALIDRIEAEAPQLASADATEAVRTDLPESLRFIRSSTKKMDDLINAILRLSREGRRVVTPEPLNMNALMEGVAGNSRHRADEKGARVEIASGLPDITSDRFAIEQIFGNLVDNAIKYLSPKRPGLIRVTGRQENGRAIFEVSDNGRGIDPRDHDRVFDLFRRSGAQDQPGEGIGLAHVRAMAYRLGGLISCESALDQGATFRLSVPLKLAVSQGVES